MAAKTLADLVTIITEEPGTIGVAELKCTPDQRITARADLEHWMAAPKHFVRFGERWVEECGRCGSTGNVGYGPFGGRCFGCNGTGGHGEGMTQDELDAKLLRFGRNAARENTAAAKVKAKVEAERAAWRAAHADLTAWAEVLTPSHLDETDGEPMYTQYGTKADSMIRRVRHGLALDPRETAYLTTVMTNAPAKEAARQAKADATRHAAEPGTRMEISGEVVKAEIYGNDSPCMLIKVQGTGAHEGITWTTFSNSNSAWDMEEGLRVTVKATIKKNDVFKGAKNDMVTRAVFTVLEEEAPQQTPAAPAAPVETAPETSVSAPLPAAQPTPKATAPAGRREAVGASVVPGWEVLYPKPRKQAEVVRNTEGAYGLVCTQHATVHPMARLSDDRALLRDGGWCCH